MDSAQVEAMLQQLGELIHSLDKDVAEIKASLAALTPIVASQLDPDDPAVGIEHIHSLERVAREADRTAEKRKQIGDVIEALKLIRKHGSHQT